MHQEDRFGNGLLSDASYCVIHTTKVLVVSSPFTEVQDWCLPKELTTSSNAFGAHESLMI
jgi:hypothetical protein